MQHGRCITFKEEKIMVVQHNLTAMNANRQLGVTTGAQAKVYREVIFWLQNQPCRQMMQQDLQFQRR